MTPRVTSFGAILAYIFIGLPSDEARARQSETYIGPQSSETIIVPDEERPESLTIRLHGSQSFTFDADFKGEDGSFSVNRTRFGVDFSGNVNEDLSLTLGFDGSLSFYDFDDADGLIPGGGPLFDQLNRTYVSLMAKHRLDGEWSLFIGGGIGFAFESGADLDDSVTGGGAVGVEWIVNKDLSLRLGVAVNSRLEDDAIVLPIIGLHWRINETTTLQTRGITPRSTGLGLRIDFELSDELALSLGGGYENFDYRLDDGHGRASNGVVRDARVPVGAALQWKPGPGVTLDVFGGMVVYQEFEFLNERGNKVTDVESDPAPFVGVGVAIVF